MFNTTQVTSFLETILVLKSIFRVNLHKLFSEYKDKDLVEKVLWNLRNQGSKITTITHCS